MRRTETLQQSVTGSLLHLLLVRCSQRCHRPLVGAAVALTKRSAGGVQLRDRLGAPRQLDEPSLHGIEGLYRTGRSDVGPGGDDRPAQIVPCLCGADGNANTLLHKQCVDRITSCSEGLNVLQVGDSVGKLGEADWQGAPDIGHSDLCPLAYHRNNSSLRLEPLNDQPHIVRSRADDHLPCRR